MNRALPALLACVLVALASAGQRETSSPPFDIDDGRQWFEPDVEASARDGLRRAAMAAAFNESDAEALLRRVIRANPASDDASHAYHLLSRIYLRTGRYQQLARNFDQWSVSFPNRPEVLAEKGDVDPFRGLPDQRNGPVRPSTLPHEAGDDWSIKVSVNGKAAEYLFDTGAAVSVISSAEARRLGLEVRAGAATMGEPSGKGVRFRTTVASDVRLGAMRFRDVSFAVIDNDDVWGILGRPIWLAVRRVVWTNGGTWEIGGRSGAVDRSARNVVFSGDKPLLVLGVAGMRAFGSLDTGAIDTDLNENFAERFADLVRSGTRGTHDITGAGGTTTFASISVPEVALQIGPTRTVLRPAHVTMQRIIGGPCCIGNIGRDLMAQTGRFELDLSAMVLRLAAARTPE